jgi:2'-5' RNA ligase
MKRLFVAIKIHPSDEFLKTCNSLKSGLRFAQITWVKPESIHITLKFFGETMENRIPDISKVLKEVALKHQPFVSEIVNVGIFGSSYSPKVIWFGIDKSEPLKKLGLDVLQSVETNICSRLSLMSIKKPGCKGSRLGSFICMKVY